MLVASSIVERESAVLVVRNINGKKYRAGRGRFSAKKYIAIDVTVMTKERKLQLH